MPTDLASTLVVLYLVAYGGVALLLFMYGMHAHLVSGLFLRVRNRPIALARTLDDDELPAVTVQLPIYNEVYVIDRLIEATCALDYPRDRLEVQVLDDSTDETGARVAQLCAKHRRAGARVVQVTREKRTGFKGGALREGLVRARGDLVAVFDADFVPPRDFLRRTVPFFTDPGVGMVQARWGHLNEDYSALTRAQAMALDGHFAVEQTVRNRTGAFINFNGTGGIWRRQCILDAGNWQDDTLTEDLDLSYRAELAGWRFVFLPDVVCPAELPVEVNGFKGQQFRWAKGSLQTARKLLPTLLRRPLPWFTKFQAVVHLTNHLVYPLLLLLALSTLPSLYILEHRPETAIFFRALTVLIIASFGHPVFYALSQQATRRQWWRRLWTVPLIIAGGMGIAINNTRAVLEALRGIDSPFERTPKYHLVSRQDSWQRKRYRASGHATSYLEVLFGLYVLAGIVYAAATGRYLILPFLVLYVLGFFYIGGLSLAHARRRRTPTADQTSTTGMYSTARTSPPTAYSPVA